MDHQVRVVRPDPRMHLEAAGMRFDYPLGDSKAKADAGVARREKRIGGVGGYLGGETGPIVVRPEGQFRPAVGSCF